MKTATAMTLVYLFIFSVMVGGLLVTPMATASTISATVTVDPEKINLTDPPESWKSPSVIAEMKFPKEYRDRIQDINGSTVLLDGVIPLDNEVADPGRYKAFFDKQVVIDHLWLKLIHMGYDEPFKNVEVEITLTGNLNDGTPFEGSDTLLVSAK
jgi:hypothetical protein